MTVLHLSVVHVVGSRNFHVFDSAKGPVSQSACNLTCALLPWQRNALGTGRHGRYLHVNLHMLSETGPVCLCVDKREASLSTTPSLQGEKPGGARGNP